MHYICTGGCEGVSLKSGVCEDKECVKHNEPLEECDCLDNLHGGAFGADTPSFDDEELKNEE